MKIDCEIKPFFLVLILVYVQFGHMFPTSIKYLNGGIFITIPNSTVCTTDEDLKQHWSQHILLKDTVMV